MTAPIGTVANRFSGLRELSNVTNTYGGYFISDGAATDLVLPWQADKLELYNYTTGANPIVWFRDMADGTALAVGGSVILTNGVTIDNLLGGFTNEHLVISGITTATPGVVTTTTNHNLSNNDRVVITKVIGSMAAQVNNQTYVVRVVSPTTFSLYDVYGIPVTILGAYTSSGQVTKICPLLGDVTRPVSPAVPHQAIIDYPPVYRLLLGTSVIGSAGNVIFFEATKMNAYFNLGAIV